MCKKEKRKKIRKSVYSYNDDFVDIDRKDSSRARVKTFAEILPALSPELRTKENLDLIYSFKNTISGYSQKKYGNHFLKIDIDQCDNEAETRNYFTLIMELFNYPKCFVEQSLTKKSYHIYIKFDTPITRSITMEVHKKIQELFNTSKVECKWFLRQPLSPTYICCDTTEKHLIHSICEGNPVYVQSIDKISYQILDKLDTVSFDLIDNLFEKKSEKEKLREEIKKSPCYIKRSSEFSKDTLFQKFNEIHTGCGDRYLKMFSKISYGSLMRMSAEQITNYILMHDSGSKDLKKWEYVGTKKRVEKILEHYKKTEECFIPQSDNFGFISNAHLVPTYIKDNANTIYNEMLLTLDYKKKNKKERTREKAHNIIIEVIGQCIYDANNKKEIVNSDFKKKLKLEDGTLYTQISSNYIEKLKDFFQIENNELNVKKLINSLFNLPLFKQVMYNYNNKEVGWFYINTKACKQYKINISSEENNYNKNSIIEKIKKYIKSIKNKYRYIISKKNIIKNLYMIDIRSISKLYTETFLNIIYSIDNNLIEYT